jgi:hypothetical protein
MNQDQVKQQLLRLKKDVPEFTVVFSGKQSKKVDGVYHPENFEIIIHNKNHETDNEIMYTAIHEFSHHVQMTDEANPPSPRSHNARYWRLFHDFLELAEKKGLYNNVFASNPEFIKLTERIKNEFLLNGGKLIKSFGEVLLKAKTLCDQHNVPFEDYIARALLLPREAARAYMRVSASRPDERLGWENMKLVSTIPDQVVRKNAQEALLEGKSVDTVKVDYKMKPLEKDPLKNLESEKQRIEKAIQRLVQNLEQVKKRIRSVKQKKGGELQL